MPVSILDFPLTLLCILAVQVVAFDTRQDMINGTLSLELLAFGLGLAAVVTSMRQEMSFPNGSVVASLMGCVRCRALILGICNPLGRLATVGMFSGAMAIAGVKDERLLTRKEYAVIGFAVLETITIHSYGIYIW